MVCLKFVIIVHSPAWLDSILPMWASERRTLTLGSFLAALMTSLPILPKPLIPILSTMFRRVSADDESTAPRPTRNLRSVN